MPDLSENLPDHINEPMATVESDSTEETPSPSPNEPTEESRDEWAPSLTEGDAMEETSDAQTAPDQESQECANPFPEQGDEEYDQDERNDLAKCVEWSESQSVVTRQQAARALPQCLYEVATVCNERQMTQLSQIITRLHKDSDPQVRVDLLDVLTHLSIICLDRNDTMALAISNLAGRHLPLPPNPLLVKLHRGTIIPCLLRLMKDRALQIRKMSHYVLLRMLECKLIAPPIITREVLPTVLELARSGKDQSWSVDMTSGDTNDQRQEAASLLSKLIQYVDKDQVTSHYLPAFLELCNDVSFHVRRACAAAMCELCQVLDAECIQNSLLTTFLSLCTDPAWSVRKSCTESFMTISCVVEPKLRQEALAPRFLHLLRDRAKWVTASAYQNLGPFISTFADPKRTGLELVRPEGAGQEAAVRRMANYDAPIHNPHESSNSDTQHLAVGNKTFEVLPDVVNKTYDYLPDVVNKTTEPVSDSASTILDSRTTFTSSNPDDATNNNGISSKQSPNSNRRSDVNFNGFLYWRSPLPDVGSLTIGDGESESSGATTSDADAQPESMENPSNEKTADVPTQKTNTEDKVDSSDSEMEVKDSNQTTTIQTGESDTDAQIEAMEKSTTGQDGDNQKASNESEEKDEMADCGVPLDLLEHFKQMLDSDVCQNVDCVDLPRSCAYSLPAVALALGPKYWRHYLLSLLNDLGVDVQWQVRHSIASSLHSLVVIVGDRDAVDYILPMFDSFSKDLDEVRLPLLRTLHQICVNLEPESRKVILGSLFEFTKSENERSWRLRDELAKQLTLIAEYYEFSDRFRYFIPIILLLLKDKVSQVRSSAADCVASVVWSGPMAIGENNTTLDATEKSQVVDSNESLNSSSGSDSGGSGRKICAPTKTTDSSSSDDCSYYDRLQLVLKTLWGNSVLVTRWQHLQAFIRALVGVVSRIPESVNILNGCDSNTNAQFEKKLSAICPKNQGLRNIVVVMSVLQPYLLEGVRHRVANVRLKCAKLMGCLINKIAQMCCAHNSVCTDCKQQDTLNSALMAIRDSTVLRISRQEKRCVLKLKLNAQEENHIPPSDAPDVDAEDKQDEAKTSETSNSAKPSQEDVSSDSVQVASSEGGDASTAEEEAARKAEEEKIRSLVIDKCKLFSAVGLNVCTTPVQSLAFDSDFDVMRIIHEALGFSFEELLPAAPPQDVFGNIHSNSWTEE